MFPSDGYVFIKPACFPSIVRRFFFSGVNLGTSCVFTFLEYEIYIYICIYLSI